MFIPREFLVCVFETLIYCTSLSPASHVCVCVYSSLLKFVSSSFSTLCCVDYISYKQSCTSFFQPSSNMKQSDTPIYFRTPNIPENWSTGCPKNHPARNSTNTTGIVRNSRSIIRKILRWHQQRLIPRLRMQQVVP